MKIQTLASLMILVVFLVLNSKHASANNLDVQKMTSYLTNPWPKGCWICPICGLCCNCLDDESASESKNNNNEISLTDTPVTSCYVGDTVIEKKEIITKCADHPHEFGTGPYMCGVKTIANDQEHSCLPLSDKSNLCENGSWKCCFTDNCNKV